MWSGGADTTITENVTIPAGIIAGNYKLFLNLPDADSALSARPEYSIRMANESTWESGTGYNDLLHTMSIAASGGVDISSPTVTAFTVPASSGSLVIGITALTATDDLGVSGYLVNESAVRPLPGATGWSALAPTNYTFASSGSKTLYAWAKDAAGNVSTSLNDSVVIDTTTPSAPGTPAFSSVWASSLTVTWSAATDNIGVTVYRLDVSTQNSFATFLSGYNNKDMGVALSTGITGLTAQTAYYARTRAYDAVGNISANSVIGSTTTGGIPDITLPAVSITAPAGGAIIAGVITVSGVSSDNAGVASVAVSVDGAPYIPAAGLASWTLSLDTTLMSNGAHTLTARATDLSGNIKTAAVSFTVDNRGPVISAVSGTGVTTTSATISWTTDEAADSQVEYGLTSAYGLFSVLATAKVTAHSQTLTGLQAQTGYHYRVRSRDAAGNLAYSGDYTFNTLSSAVPAVSILSPVDGQKIDRTVSVSLSGSAGALVARAELLADGVQVGLHNFTPAVASFSNVIITWKTTSGGNHTLQARVFDTAGVSGTSGIISVRAAGKSKVALVGYSGNQQQDVTGGSGDIQPRALLLSRKAGQQQTLVFDEDVKEAALVDLKGRVLKRASRQGGSLVLSLQGAQDTGIGMTSGLLMIQMKDSSGKYSVKPLMVVK